MGRPRSKVGPQESIQRAQSHLDRGSVRGTSARDPSRNRPAADKQASGGYGFHKFRERVGQPPLLNGRIILGGRPSPGDTALGHNAMGSVPRFGHAAPGRSPGAQQSKAATTKHSFHQHGCPAIGMANGLPERLPRRGGKGAVDRR